MTLHTGSLLTFDDVTLIKNVSAGQKYVSTTYDLLPTISNNFNCIWADKDSSQTKGKVYFSTVTGLYVIDLSKKVVYQSITPFENNVTGEVLESVGIIDLNVTN